MRILLRVLAAVAILLVAALIAAAVILPGVVDSDAVRERIGVAAEAALGRSVRYGALGINVFPPSVVVEDVVIAGETDEAPALLEGERLALQFSLLPLLARTLVVDSLSLQGARLNLVRTAEGLQIPSGEAGGGESPPDEAGSEGAGIDLAIAGFDLENATIVLEDRSVSPAVTWDLRNVSLRVRGVSADDPVDLDFGFELGSGGTISGSGEAALAGDIDLEVKLADVALAPASPYIESGSKLDGRLSGTIAASGPVDNLESLRVDANLVDGRFTLDDMTVVGSVQVVADLHGSAAAPRGSFDIDATDAEVRYGGMFTKPPGDAATLRGKLVEGEGGATGIDDLHFKVRNFKGTASVKGGPRTHVVVNAQPFDLRGWDALIPALAGYSLSGPLGFDSFDLRTEPVEVRGRLVLDGITTVLPNGGPIRLQGALVGAEESITSENLRIIAADQPVAVEASLSDLGGRVQFRARSSMQGADLDRLMTVFASKPDFAFGRLDMNGDLGGALAGKRAAVETLTGNAGIAVGPGRLAGVSLLKLTFQGFEGIASVGVLASQLLGGPNLQPFYGDEFNSIRGNFDFVAGVVKTDDLHIVYPDYVVALRGTLRLADLGMDMRGEIELGQKLAAELGRGDQSAKSNRIKIAHVTGTLDDPGVHVSPEVAAAFLGRSGLNEKAGKAAGDAVGGATGEAVGDLVEGILGGALGR